MGVVDLHKQMPPEGLPAPVDLLGDRLAAAHDEDNDEQNGEDAETAAFHPTIVQRSSDDTTRALIEKDEEVEGEDEEEDEGGDIGDSIFFEEEILPPKKETMRQFLERQYQNLVHFLVEDWFLSAMLGVITAVLSISTDVAIEYLLHFKHWIYEAVKEHHAYGGLLVWVAFITSCVGLAALICYALGKQAVGSGIPEVKVIMHGFVLKNYLSLRTLVAKVIGLVLTLGGGLPVGKEGPFVHMGAIVASLLNKATAACQYNMFFSNEGRQMEMLSSGCAVGIACTFSAPAGAVLYGIESTSKYFAVKNYWRAFFATTCSALIFRFAMAVIVPPHIAGTITAYYQTSFPNEVFLVEEIPVFALIGVLSGLLGAFFVFVHRRIAHFREKNKAYKALFGRSPMLFTVIMAAIVGLITYPEGFGKYIAGKLTFRESLADFVANCTFSLSNITENGCSPHMISHWTGGPDGGLHIALTLSLYLLVNFFLVAICVSLYIPAGIFVPSFVIGACGGRLIGELMAMSFPEGIRGPDNPQIYPGLYAVVGAAAYTGSVTHSLSIALIVCETTGQLCALLPVLIALMIGNAISSFLQPSIYESIIAIKKYPYLADLPPSRVSVHKLKVEKVMVKDVVCITRETTYKELREILLATPHLRSYPYVTDRQSMTLLGSVARKYLCYLLMHKLGPEPSFQTGKRRSRTASEILSTLRRNSTANGMNQLGTHFLTDRNISGNTLLAHSPLHDDQAQHGPLAQLLYSQSEPVERIHNSLQERTAALASKLDLDDVAIDAAPFQLVKGTSLYKVHTLFSLLGLNHAYVTEKGRLVGVVALKELRNAFSNIYSRGAVAPRRRRRPSFRYSTTATATTSAADQRPPSPPHSPSTSSSSSASNKALRVVINVPNDHRDQ